MSLLSQIFDTPGIGGAVVVVVFGALLASFAQIVRSIAKAGRQDS